MMRFKGLVFACVGLLSSCSSDPYAMDSLRRVSSLTNAPAQSPERYMKLVEAGAPAMVISVEKRAGAVEFRLAGGTGPIETWIGSDGVSVSMHNGLLVETRGLGGDLMASEAAQTADGLARLAGRKTHRKMDVLAGNDKIAALDFSCQLEHRGRREVAGQMAHLMAEHCRGGTIEFTNLYWITRGQIVQSRQWAGPFNEMLAIRQR